MLELLHTPGSIVRACSPAVMERLLEKGRREAKAAMARGDTELGMTLGRRNAGYILFLRDFKLSKRR